MRHGRKRQAGRGTARPRRVRVQPLWKELSTDELAKALAVYLTWQAAQPAGRTDDTPGDADDADAPEKPAASERGAASDDCSTGGRR